MELEEEEEAVSCLLLPGEAAALVSASGFNVLFVLEIICVGIILVEIL